MDCPQQLPFPSPPFPLLNLPLDLLYTLTADHLDPVSSIALSLTCHSLTSFLPHSFRRLTTRQQKLSLLALLERSTPNTILCFACLKLHTTDHKPTGLPQSVFELGWSCKYAHAWTPSAPGPLGLSFRDARAVTIHNPASLHTIGLPISILTTKATDPIRLVTPHGITRPVATERTAKMLTGNLLIRYSYTFHIHALPTDIVAASIESLRFGVCQHVEVSGQAVLDAVAGVGDDLPGSTEIEGRTRACAKCRMDYAVSWGVRDRRDVVVIRSWHCFGRVEEPWGGEWGRAVARRRASLGGKGEEGEANDGGVVQAMWESG